MKMLRKIALLFSLITLVVACSGDDSESPTDTGDSFDRTAMLTNWADNIILPAYNNFASELQDLKSKADVFNSSPDAASLQDLRASWIDAYHAWQRVSMFEIGPAEARNYRSNINIYPANPTLIESNISDGNYNLDLASNRVAKGMPALDYLLYGIETNEEDIASVFSGAEGAGHRAYLSEIIVDMIDLTNQVKGEWESGFRDNFVNNNGSSANASVDRYVNDFIFYYEKHLRAGKMGIPLGVFTGTKLPENIEAYYNSEISKELFITGLDAVQNFFNGISFNGNTQGESLNSYLAELNTVVDGANLGQIINNQLNTARTFVSGLDNFKDELELSPPTRMLQAYDEVQKVVPLMKVDMVSAMSISIDYVDADGD